MDGATGSATTNDSSGRQVARRQRATFGSSAKGGDELSESS